MKDNDDDRTGDDVVDTAGLADTFSQSSNEDDDGNDDEDYDGEILLIVFRILSIGIFGFVLTYDWCYNLLHVVAVALYVLPRIQMMMKKTFQFGRNIGWRL